jgi:SM-20-related protein
MLHNVSITSSVDQLAERGYVVLTDMFNTNLLQKSLAYLKQQQVRNAFKKAAIGNLQNQVVAQEIRGDEIYWLNKEKDSALSELFVEYDKLVSTLKNEMRISLVDYEIHFAHYPVGTFYKKHVDTFQTDTSRVFSVVLYLNENWCEEDGGHIALYPTEEEQILVPPKMGTMVIFNSLQIPHEVLPTNASRYSLTGWILNRPTLF